MIRRFPGGHPDQVLIVIVEDYVPPRRIEQGFEQTGLARYVATLDRHEPPPTLGTLIARGERLVVFAEEQGGSPAWYMPAFSFIQDTPLGATRPDQLSCKRYRGEADSPLLLINYWIPPFPPSPTLNAAIGRAFFLRGRIERCLRKRGCKGRDRRRRLLPAHVGCRRRAGTQQPRPKSAPCLRIARTSHSDLEAVPSDAGMTGSAPSRLQSGESRRAWPGSAPERSRARLTATGRPRLTGRSRHGARRLRRPRACRSSSRSATAGCSSRRSRSTAARRR